MISRGGCKLFREIDFLWESGICLSNHIENGEANIGWKQSELYKNMGDHLQFVFSSIDSAQPILGSEKCRELLMEAELIKDRYIDPNLYLVIVGEFSSGKSTLINAILEQELLKADILQGTTKNITKIMYGDTYSVEMHLQEGLIGRYIPKLPEGTPCSKDNREWLERRINEALSFCSEKEHLREIVVKVPNEYLKTGIVLVDTPGINSVDYPIHDEIAKQAIHQVGDMTVVLTVAEQIANNTLGKFITESLKGQFDTCWFLMTQADTIEEEEELPRLMRVFRNRLQRQLEAEIGLAQMDYCAAKYAIPKFKDQSELSAQWYPRFLQTKEKLWMSLQERRIYVQSKKILQLVNCMYHDISRQLETQNAIYEERQKRLEENKIINLLEYINCEKKIFGEKVDLHYEMAVGNILDCYRRCFDEIATVCSNRIYTAKDISKAEAYLKQELFGQIQRYAEHIELQVQYLLSKCDQEIQSDFVEFELRFENNYKELERLNIGKLNFSNKIGCNRAFEKVNVSQFAERLSFIGATGIGAVIGSLLVPGIGSLLGGYMGRVVEDFFGPSLNEKKERLHEAVYPIIAKVFNDSYEKIFQNIMDRADRQKIMLINNIDCYYRVYENVIAEMIEKDKRERNELRNKINLGQNLLSSITEKRKEVQNIQENLIWKIEEANESGDELVFGYI